jgi:NAD(P)-dependent dehydrogenase (short-subunit alcohol dehydrogenase family)
MQLSTFRLDERVAVVFGAGSGIGEAVAKGLAAHGARVTCADLDGTAAGGVAAEIVGSGGLASGTTCDIRDVEAVRRTIGETVEQHGRIDIAVTTPGINVRKPVLDYEPEEFDRVIAVNLKGTFNVLQASGRAMATQGSGSIIAFSSIRSQTVEPGQSVYAATKAGIVQLARTLAAELGPSGVRVNCIAPGVVDTPLTAPIKSNPEWYEAYAAKSAIGRWANVAEMVGPTVFLASEASSYVTGTVLFVDGGWTAIDGRFTPPGM